MGGQIGNRNREQKSGDTVGTEIGNRQREQKSGDTAGEKSGRNLVIRQILEKLRAQKSGTEIRDTARATLLT